MTPPPVLRPLIVFALVFCAAYGPSEQKPAEGAGTSAGTTTTTASQAVQPPPATAQSAAESIKAVIPEATELIEVTEDNDPNNLIGRPNGYLAATVLVDSRLPKCADLGADCGVMIEQWPDQAAAQNRSDYIQSTLKSMPMLGQEWNTIRDGLLLRVAGELKPSEA